MLTATELERYRRQIIIHGFGEAGQERLKQARVFVAGVGGLGSPACLYLAAAGVGTLRIVDRDSIELSNLNRQLLHWDENLGMTKAESAADKLRRANPQITVETICETISEDNASRLTDGFELILDAMDNMPARYLLNRIAVEKSIPFVHGAVLGFEGRATTVLPGRSACLYCIYRGAIPPGDVVPVIGVTPGVIGCIQATEAIKYILGTGELLADRFLVYNGLKMKFTEFKVHRDPNCAHCGHVPAPAEGS